MDSQSKQTLSKFEIIGSTYINIIYNNIYNNSIISNTNLKNAYVANILDYLNSSKDEEFFIQSIHCICTYFKSSTKYTDLSFNNCIDLLIMEFVPTNFINQLNKQQKHKILHSVLHNTLKRVVSLIIKEYIPIIIDNHNDLNNLVKLQDIYLKSLLYEKNMLLSKFADPDQKDEDHEKVKIFELLEKFKQEVLTLKEKNENLNKSLTESSDRLNKLKSDYSLCLENNKSIQSKLYQANLEIEQLNMHIKTVSKYKSQPRIKPQIHAPIIQEETQIIIEDDEEFQDEEQKDNDENSDEEKSINLNYDSENEEQTEERNIFDTTVETVQKDDINKILKRNGSLLDSISFDKSVIVNKHEDDCLRVNEHLDKLKTNKINETLLFC